MHEGETPPRSKSERERDFVWDQVANVARLTRRDYQHLTGKQLRQVKHTLAVALAEATHQHDIRQEQSHAQAK